MVYITLICLLLSTVLPVVPVVQQNQTVVTFAPDGSIDGPPQWTCAAVGSTQDYLEWEHNGNAVPVVSSNTTQDFNCSAFDLPPPYVTVANKENIGRYKTHYQLTLHLCNATEKNVGSYQCHLHRWNGISELVLEVKLQGATGEGSPSSITTVPTTAATGPTTAATGPTTAATSSSTSSPNLSGA